MRNMSLKYLFLVAAVVALSGVSSAVILLDETWADGSRAEKGTKEVIMSARNLAGITQELAAGYPAADVEATQREVRLVLDVALTTLAPKAQAARRANADLFVSLGLLRLPIHVLRRHQRGRCQK